MGHQIVEVKRLLEEETKHIKEELGRLAALLGLSLSLMCAGGSKLFTATKEYQKEMGILLKEEKKLASKTNFDGLPVDFTEIDKVFLDDSPRKNKAYKSLEKFRKELFIRVPMFLVAGGILLMLPINRALNYLGLMAGFLLRAAGERLKQSTKPFIQKEVLAALKLLTSVSKKLLSKLASFNR